MDITGYCRDLIKILEQAENMSEKLTPLKLIDAWSGKGVSKLRVAEVTPPKHPREELERIIAHLLLQQYLKYVRRLLLFLTSSSHFSLLSCYFCIVLMDTCCRLLFSLISDAFNVFLKTSKDVFLYFYFKMFKQKLEKHLKCCISCSFKRLGSAVFRLNP